jgi:pilus assembly protein CpaE
MLGEMDTKSPVVATINEIAHVLTGRSEIKVKKRAGLGNILGKLKRGK